MLRKIDLELRENGKICLVLHYRFFSGSSDAY